jgi:hypothetical protein
MFLVKNSSRHKIHPRKRDAENWWAETGARNRRPPPNPRRRDRLAKPRIGPPAGISNPHWKSLTERGLAGWGGRIRISIWRNQNPLHLTISLWQPAPSACQEKGARYPQRFASHWIVRSGQTQLKRAAHQLQAPTSLITRWNLPQAPK